MSRTSQHYNVLIDFYTPAGVDTHELLSHHIHSEDIGDNQFQVGISVRSSTMDQAYLRGVTLLKAEMDAWTDDGIDVIETHVYGPEGPDESAKVYR